MINGKHGQGTHCTKMGADSLAENTPNLSAQFVCLSPKVWYFDEKRLHWASVVRGVAYGLSQGYFMYYFHLQDNFYFPIPFFLQIYFICLGNCFL